MFKSKSKYVQLHEGETVMIKCHGGGIIVIGDNDRVFNIRSLEPTRIQGSGYEARIKIGAGYPGVMEFMNIIQPTSNVTPVRLIIEGDTFLTSGRDDDNGKYTEKR